MLPTTTQVFSLPPYLARHLTVGTVIECDDLTGTIRSLQPAGLEVDVGGNRVRLVPYTALLTSGITTQTPPNEDA